MVTPTVATVKVCLAPQYWLSHTAAQLVAAVTIICDQQQLVQIAVGNAETKLHRISTDHSSTTWFGIQAHGLTAVHVSLEADVFKL